MLGWRVGESEGRGECWGGGRVRVKVEVSVRVEGG